MATPLLGQASIVIDQATLGPGVAGVSRDDGVLSEVVTLRNADNTNVTRHQWILIKPRASTATLSAPTSASCQFTPDADGTYAIVLLVNEGRGRYQVQRRLLGVRSSGGYRYPSQGESNEANWASLYTLTTNETGWWEDMDAILRANQAFPDASLLTVDTEGDLGNSRRLVAGAGITVSDGGPGGDFEISTTLSSGVKSLLDVVGEAENLVGVRTVKPPTRDVLKYGQVNLGSESLAGKGTSGRYATVSGGLNNTASSNNATVAGGTANLASGDGAAVLGGSTNTASGATSTVAGGANNVASVLGAAIGGGTRNAASGGYAFIGAGLDNTASGSTSAVAGGNANSAIGDGTFVGAGNANEVEGDNACIVGGYENVIGSINPADFSCIVGGYQNVISKATASCIVGGQDNDASSDYASIVGGLDNQCNSTYAHVGGGAYNVADGSYDAIAGGYGNNVTGDYGTIAGGLSNVAALASFVGGGYNNAATGTYSGILHGASNSASGDYSHAGGRSSTASGTNSIALGYNANATHAGSIVIKDGDSTSRASSAANEVTIQGLGGVRVYFYGSKFRRSGFSSSTNYHDTYEGSATTTGALLTSTTICSIPTNQDVHIRGVLKGKKSSSVDYAHRIYEGAFVNNGGAITTVTALTNSFGSAGSGNLYAATIGVSGTDIAISYQGVAATTVRWTWHLEVFIGGTT